MMGILCTGQSCRRC